jgi:hypothetical protein
MALTNVYTGSNGTLTLANEDTPEGADAQRITELFEIQTVGRVTDVHVHVRTDLEEFHETGRRHATSLHPGNIHIGGSVGRAYINGALLFLLLGRGASPTALPEPYVQPTFSMSLALNDPAVPGNRVSLELKGVKFESWSLSMPEQDFVLENLPFKALTVSVVDSEAPADGGDPVAKAPEFPDAAPA